ncbi:hypothetical protein D623_10020136 [Myotis brandtii]|uniref:Uncharacterized protein n=1 Tax=Myotis brandtii TaxID=109478 RepID=S7MWF2_MYOBR|nr:hypothetical protein D623_10020136 [Myotis brandtii]
MARLSRGRECGRRSGAGAQGVWSQPRFGGLGRVLQQERAKPAAPTPWAWGMQMTGLAPYMAALQKRNMKA